jgi:transcriptional regulator with XRE-family HTH domain
MTNKWTKEDLIQWRTRMGMNQTEAAKRLGYTNRSAMCRYERGHAEVPTRLQLLCQEIEKKSPSKP